VNILVVNWQDRLNPHAGGAEIHLFELFGRLARRGHRVRLVCSGWPGAAAREVVDGIQVERSGGRHTFALTGRQAVRRALAAERPDIVVEDINKLPLFLAGLTPAPFCVIVPHLFGSTAFQEVSWPMAAIVWLAERPIPRVYRRAGFHAISESTRDDLVARGVARERIRVIHPGVDSARYAPDPAVRRSNPPSFLYMGRLKRYKGVDLAIRALGQALQRHPGLALDVAGAGDDGPVSRDG
jgi:glycosyltransferase involved in cell wall biosynthesis